MENEKFCLRWNDFEKNISSAFRYLRDDKEFFDVTLVCEDEQIQSHKVILAACSPFFHQVLTRNPHQHPLVYMKGIKCSDVKSVLDFMYHGEVNVAQEELNSFLAPAEDLKGLQKYIFLIFSTEGKTFSCFLCGKTTTKSSNMRQYFEAFHFSLGEMQCEVCDKVFKARHSLATHFSKHHRNNDNADE